MHYYLVIKEKIRIFAKRTKTKTKTKNAGTNRHSTLILNPHKNYNIFHFLFFYSFIFFILQKL